LGSPALTQKTDCNGANKTNALTSIITSTKMRSTFAVNDLEVRVDGAIVINSIGKVELLSSDGSVRQTYTKTLKQSVNWQVYKASQSASGTSRTCSIVSNELYCWGTNDYGQLGNGQGGTGDYSYTPVKVVQETGVLAGKVIDDVFAAQWHNCALATGKVYCWGLNTSGQLGNGTTTNSNKPVEVGGALAGKTVTAIGGTGNSSCAIAGGKIYCWGENGSGTVGNNSTTDVKTPTLVSTTNLGSSYTATALSTSGSRSYNMCAIVNGKAWCWGNNESGQVGNGVANTTLVLVPTKVIDTGVLSGKTVTSISQDGYFNGNNGNGDYTHVCVVANGAGYCWGENDDGQLGNNTVTTSSVPVAVTTSGALAGKTMQDIVAGLKHTCALANSKVYCWGNSSSGQLGNGGNTSKTVPTAVIEQAGGLQGKTITAIGGGANRGCAVANFQSYCWGLNTDGQIGDGTQTNRYVPTESLFLRPQAPAFIF
jgi:alpha-tubulin suppressor-like RCC1 family protein